MASDEEEEEDVAAQKYQEFLDFDWSSEGWQSYLAGLYPPPNQRQQLKFKKKWYKKHVDPEFDDTYEPAGAAAAADSTTSGPAAGGSAGSAGSAGGTACATASEGSGSAGGSAGASAGGSGGGSAESGASYATTAVLQGDVSRWAAMVPKASICFAAYAVALALCPVAAVGVIPIYQALIVLVCAFVLEVLAKYGLKFNSGYWHSILLDDAGVMPIMILTLLMPGLHPTVRTLTLAPPLLTALMSFAQICKAHPKLPGAVKEFFAPLAEVSARYQIIQMRAHVEVALGFILFAAMFAVRAAPISVLLYWNFMMMRYMMNPWTQATFRRIDEGLNPVLGRIPLVRNGYAALKRMLYGFVDPQSKNKSS